MAGHHLGQETGRFPNPLILESMDQHPGGARVAEGGAHQQASGETPVADRFEASTTASAQPIPGPSSAHQAEHGLTVRARPDRIRVT